MNSRNRDSASTYVADEIIGDAVCAAGNGLCAEGFELVNKELDIKSEE